MEIRPIRSTDTHALKAALALVRDVFWDFEAPEYSDEGVLEFESFIDCGAMATRLKDGQLLMWGAFQDVRPLGVLAVKPPCHISLLFVHKAVHRRGIATALVAHLRDEFSDCTDCPHITVHSSPYAVPVYQRLGFAPIGPEKTENGIRYTPMQSPMHSPAQGMVPPALR